jgi:hypothetical protein
VPLSLLLAQHLTFLTQGVKKLDRWEGLTDTFALVARRLRGAFMVGWFGPGIPVQGLDVVVTVTNLDELYDRYLQVTSGNRGSGSRGPNLTEPLLGGAGVLAGALANPLNGMVASMILGSVLHSWYVKLIAGLGWVSAGGLTTALLLIAAPLIALGLIPQAFGGQAGDAFDLLGALAAMALPLRRLWRQLSGRESARNPLLRQLMTLGDRLAALLAQVLGAVAVTVTRIAPQLYPAMAAARATYAAVVPIGEAIHLVVLNMLDALGLLLHGPLSLGAVQGVVIRALRAMVGRLRGLVLATIAEVVTIATARVGPTMSAVATYMVQASRFVRAVILETPFVRWLLAVRDISQVVQRWSSRPVPPPPTPRTPAPPSPWLTSFPMPASLSAFGRLLRKSHPVPLPTATAPPFVGPGVVAPIADVLRALPFLTDPDPFALDDAQRASVRRFRRPPSVLGGLAADLQARRDAADRGGAAFALADLYAGRHPYVDRSLALLGPGAAASVVPRLEGLLDRLDVELRGRRPSFPVRDLPEPAAIRPVVGRLVVRSGGGGDVEGRSRAFVETLRQQLDARSYVVTAAGAGAR